MPAKYLIRFDDVCAEMNWHIWDEVESILDEYDICPILAIVPNNQDNKLMVNPPNFDFWSRARNWQRKGWSIGLHGYNHVYETTQSGLIGLNSRSEFAGLPINSQRRKIEDGISILKENGLMPLVWVAPAHSFDKNTVLVLISLGVNIVSDGYFRRVVKFFNLVWVPQQLWKFEFKSDGVWTICFHINMWTPSDLDNFRKCLKKYRSNIFCLEDVVGNDVPSLNFFDQFFSKIWYCKLVISRLKSHLFECSKIINSKCRKK